MSDLSAVGILVLLLALNAFFVGAEFALISARRTQIEPKVAEGSRAARSTLRAMENVSLVMAGAQLGITACSLGLGAIGEPAVAHLIEPGLHALHVPDDFLHPTFAPGLPLFVPVEPFPAMLANRSPGEQLALLAHLRTKVGRLHYGAALQRVGRPLSARRVFDDAVRLAPADPETLTAAAVARFDKDRPALAFSRLGPLTRRFPQAQTVRFHLGLLLVWSGDAEGDKRQLRRVRALGPETRLGREAKRFLDRL